MPVLIEALKLGHSIRAGEELTHSPGEPQRLFVQTAGSSGTPKLIRRSPNSWIRSFEANQSLFAISDDDTYAVLGHLGHSLALYGAVEALQLGCDLAVLSDISPLRQANALDEFDITVLYATPTQLRLISQSQTKALKSVRLVMCGGGKLDADLRETLMQSMPNARVIEFFGASETSFISIADQTAPDGSVGKPYPGVSIKIGKGEEVGEIWVKSPYLFEGYGSGESADTKWDGGYLSIGEIGTFDRSGCLYLKGRKSRMVTVADQNVFPEAIEATLLEHSEIREAAVITPSDPKRGNSIVAFVVGKADEAALRKSCRQNVGKAAVPRQIVFCDLLPKLTAGKPDLQRLMTLWQEAAK